MMEFIDGRLSQGWCLQRVGVYVCLEYILLGVMKGYVIKVWGLIPDGWSKSDKYLKG